MDIVVIANQKGGCAKTTTTVNLAAGLAERGQRVLVADLDPQANTTAWFKSSQSGASAGSWTVLHDQAAILALVTPTGLDGVDLLAGSRQLANLEKALAGELAVETRLKRAFATIPIDQYDVILIDTPPTLGLLTLNALTAAQWLLVPVTTHVMSLSGVAQLLSTVADVKSLLNPDLKILGFVPCRVDTRTRHARDILQVLKDRFADQLCETHIRENIRIAEAPSFHESILTYSGASGAAKDYRALAGEIQTRLQMEKN
jgi:chromosome partitioning protein